MRTKLRTKTTLLVVMCALLIAVPAVAAIADNVQVNDMAAGANVTKTPGETGTASVRIIANSDPNRDRANCNVSAKSPATVSLSASPNKITFDSTAQITSCKNAGTKRIGYTVSPTAQAGDVITVSTTTTDSDAKTLYHEGSFTVTVVAPPNTAPVANDASATTNEDNSVTITLSGSDADGDFLTFNTDPPDNGQLGPIILTSPTTATVDYKPNDNYNGSDSFTYTVSDGNGGTDTADVTITVIPVNDPPSFTAGGDQTVLEDSGAQTFPNWATAISAGPGDEAGQTVSFVLTNDNPALFSSQPAISPSGTLTFTPATNAFGTATVTVFAQDNGGMANGGDDTSDTQTFTITVTGVNDAPSFTAGGDVTVNEDSGAYSAVWAPVISAGPANESGQTVTFTLTNDNPALFSSQPAISPSGTLSFTPAANAFGTATVTVFLTDNGGIANGGDDTSPTQTFTITVNAVDD